MKSHLKYTAPLLLGIGFLSTAFAADGNFQLKGNFQTQATKDLYDNDSESNLDGFWIRGNAGFKYTSDDFDATFDLRMWGPAYNAGSERICPRLYFGNYKWAMSDSKFNVKFGQWDTDWSVGGNFGTYLDKKIGGHGFLSRGGAVQDGVELGWKYGPSTLNAMIATKYDANDANSTTPYNQGYVRLEDNLKAAGLDMTVGYRVNALDPMLKPAVLTHRIGMKASYTLMPSLKLYGEVAYITTGKDSDVKTDSDKTWTTAVKPEYTQDTDYLPFFVGLEVPTGGILNNLLFEMEYIGDRDELVAGTDDLAWTVAVVKKLGRTKIQFSVFSEKKIDDPSTGLRLTTGL